MLGNQIKQHLETLSPSGQSITKPDYADIVLSEEETIEALRIGRETKNDQIVKERYWAKINAQVDWNMPNAREIYEGLLKTKSQTGKPFQVTEGNKETIHNLCLYFSHNESFNSRGKDFSLDKGILLVGIPGVGKTHLMDFFKKNPRASYTVPTCKLISERYVQGWKRDDMSTIEYYSTLHTAEIGHPYNQEHLGVCFGDLGAESESNNYGNKRNVIEEIVFNRYEYKFPFKFTHFTSNFNLTMIGDKYGERMLDRLREMCNVLILEGESFRS